MLTIFRLDFAIITTFYIVIIHESPNLSTIFFNYF
jgi:hypothetical protein